MDAKVWIIILLGNPGAKYAKTRHNVGWWVGDILASDANTLFDPGWGQFYYARAQIEERSAALVKPTTYMNSSGQVIAELSERVEVTTENLIVVADDIDLPLGQLRVRSNGSSGGHNGLASIIEATGNDEFVRVRCGVGPLPADIDAAEFVLAPFDESELSSAREMTERAAAAVRIILTDGVLLAANTFNRKPPAPEAPSGDQSGADRPREGT